ncbi:BPSL0761 family protein [Novilysobacter concretionis]|uniref:BPSL0761 family protein n=1 Tax=Novilysobacter concretionis TaxID=262325 RepID=UPI003CCDEFC0
MSTPDERTLCVLQTRRFLRSLRSDHTLPEPVRQESHGFSPDSADTFTKIHTGSEECPCPSASVTALSTSVRSSSWSGGRS